MMISNHELFGRYVSYLDSKKSKGMSNGAYALMKISKHSFDDFVFEYQKNESFKDLIEEIYKSEIRNDKIDGVLGKDI